MVALASGEVTDGVSLDLLRAVATETVIAAIRAAVRLISLCWGSGLAPAREAPPGPVS